MYEDFNGAASLDKYVNSMKITKIWRDREQEVANAKVSFQDVMRTTQKQEKALYLSIRSAQPTVFQQSIEPVTQDAHENGADLPEFLLIDEEIQVIPHKVNVRG